MALEMMLDENLFYEENFMSSRNIALYAIEKFPNEGKKQIYSGYISDNYKSKSVNIRKDIEKMV